MYKEDNLTMYTGCAPWTSVLGLAERKKHQVQFLDNPQQSNQSSQELSEAEYRTEKISSIIDMAR